MSLIKQLNDEISIIEGVKKKCKKKNSLMAKYYQGRIDAFKQVIAFILEEQRQMRREHGVYE